MEVNTTGNPMRTFKITEAQYRCWPSTAGVDLALRPFVLTVDAISSVLTEFAHTFGPSENGGLQQYLAKALERYLKERLVAGRPIRLASTRYSPALNERADAAFKADEAKGKVFVEIEFRPNVEKDLVKFQIGANSGTLGVAILVLAGKRNDINPAYPTMPEYGKFVRVIEQLRPTYPMLLLGFRGTMGHVKD